MEGSERITVNLSARGAAALAEVQRATGEGKTEAVNDALRLYAMVLSKPDAQLALIERDGQVERILMP